MNSPNGEFEHDFKMARDELPQIASLPDGSTVLPSEAGLIITPPPQQDSNNVTEIGL